MRSKTRDRRAAAGRDLVAILAVLALSAGMALATNLCWHKMPALRPDNGFRTPPPPPPDKEGGAIVEHERIGPNPLSLNGNGLTADDVLRHLHHGTAHFVDAREQHEYAAGHLIGAIHLPSSAVYDRISAVTSMISPGETIVVYCSGAQCESGHLVAGVLRNEFGYTDVRVYKNGWEEILASGKFSDCIATGKEP